MVDNASQLFRVMGDPIRLRILHLLNAGELCVGDLVTVLDVPQPTASRHLAYLPHALGFAANCSNVSTPMTRVAPGTRNA